MRSLVLYNVHSVVPLLSPKMVVSEELVDFSFMFHSFCENTCREDGLLVRCLMAMCSWLAVCSSVLFRLYGREPNTWFISILPQVYSDLTNLFPKYIYISSRNPSEF